MDVCDRCGVELSLGMWPWCPHGFGTSRYAPDEIPGGLVIENLGHHDVTVYSKSEIRRLATARGLEPMVRHVPMPGTDKSPFTTNWAAPSAETLANVKALLERVGRPKQAEPTPQPDDVRADDVATLLVREGIDL